MLDIYKTRYILDKIKKNNEKFDDTNILIGTDDKLPDNITLKNVVILIIFVLKDDGKLCPQIFKKHCLLNKHGFPQDSGIDAWQKMRKRNKWNLVLKMCLVCMGISGVVVITTAQLHSTKPELRFCAGSNPARGVLEIRDGEDL